MGNSLGLLKWRGPLSISAIEGQALAVLVPVVSRCSSYDQGLLDEFRRYERGEESRLSDDLRRLAQFYDHEVNSRHPSKDNAESHTSGRRLRLMRRAPHHRIHFCRRNELLRPG